jgi:hypothetical protein
MVLPELALDLVPRPQSMITLTAVPLYSHSRKNPHTQLYQELIQRLSALSASASYILTTNRTIDKQS